MQYWRTHTGPLLSGPQEVLVATQGGASIYDGDTKTKYQGGTVSVTTHHIFFTDSSGSPILRLELENLHKSGQSPVHTRGSVFSSDKIVFSLPGGRYGKLSFKEGGAKEVFTALEGVLQKKQWRIPAPTTTASGPSSAAPQQQQQQQQQQGAGVGGANDEGDAPRPTPELRTGASHLGIAGVQLQSQQAAKLQDGTLRDVDDVMSKASSLVGSIRALKGKAGNTADETSAIESIEATLGLGTLVTKDGSGSQAKFTAELAQEMHAWMTHERNRKLFGSTPIFPLIELFSLYNRARSGDLVSPDDVLAACRYMSRQEYSLYSLETLSSGRVALVHRDVSILLNMLTQFLGPQLVSPKDRGLGPAARGAVLTSTTDASGNVSSNVVVKPSVTVPTTMQFPASSAALKSVTDIEFSAALKSTTTVARDTLERLERQGYLCSSDAGFGCLTFYWNIFIF